MLIVQKSKVLSMPVDVICYGERTHYDTREEAITHFMTAMFATEGSECERYTKIYTALQNTDAPVVSDGEPEEKSEVEKADSSLLEVKKIVELISAGTLNINSPEVYDDEKSSLVIEDREIIKALLKKDGWYAAQFLRKYIANDRELIMDVAFGGEDHCRALAYASPELCDDKEFVLKLIEIDASDFRHVSDRLSNDIDVVAAAYKHAVTDYDKESIKENLGDTLLADMIATYSEKQRGGKTLDNIISDADKLKSFGRKDTKAVDIIEPESR